MKRITCVNSYIPPRKSLSYESLPPSCFRKISAELGRLKCPEFLAMPMASSSGFIFTKASFLISRNKQQNLGMKDQLQDFSLPKTPHLSCSVIPLHNSGEVRTSFIFVFSLPNNINKTVISIYRILLSAP